jgi:hypothetical protein
MTASSPDAKIPDDRAVAGPGWVLLWALVLAIAAVSVGVAIERGDSSAAVTARPRAPSAPRRPPAQAEIPRRLSMTGAVTAFDPGRGTLRLVLDGQQYGVRFSPGAVTRLGCLPDARPSIKESVRLWLAAYLDGPMTVVAWQPLSPEARCGHG